MASRRVALADVPSAANSPMRNTNLINGKRTRAQAGEQRDAIFGQPPAKKHILEVPTANDENVDPRRRNGMTIVAVDKLEEPFLKRASHGPPTAFEKKLASVREKRPTLQQQVHTQQVSQRQESRAQRQHAENLESIRQWQKHYRRQFPQFVFYFDSVADDVRHKAARKIHALGAREDKFFSKAVTHVVTTRTIPAEGSSTSTDNDEQEAARQRSTQQSVAALDQRRTTNALDAHIQRRSQLAFTGAQAGTDARRPQAYNAYSTDILSKARSLNTKIWALEKLHRVLDTILDTETADQAAEPRGAATRVSSRPAPNADLEQLLRHEKVKGPADRDMTVATQDMVTLRGCYIYIHDMDEKTKPVMVRDYLRPQAKEQGKWPQFRLSAPGRCPFVEDPAHTKKLAQQDREIQEAREDLQRKTRAKASSHSIPPLQGTNPYRETTLRRSPRKLTQSNLSATSQAGSFQYQGSTMRQPSGETLPPLFNSTQANLRGMPRMVRGEPVASGVQPSNVTSAIRSQAVSSAAISSTTGLSRRVGDSREMSMLKRKVLGSNTVPTSYTNDMRAAINEDAVPPPRAAKRKAQETLGVLHETEVDADAQASAHIVKKKKIVEKEAKPGYCENCRDKFDDFDDHIASRKHRKFATSAENWHDLDELLAVLKRPHKKKQPL
ncbi:Putative Zinc finger, DBF-type, regulatory subunit Dfp1/Him1, central region [Septoria linicola]|uniref:Zinc finger, DBF-type, regulatory subunit Dfp1/Him1, central region n=1 Tax=Septoria linicola TaxID=215465 RepID=A0A9Q9AEX0_9PEZI|nr:Putative Zinc finger, DBF-type, regulatory subunit Dfp1/Him1, central region [Septoria linicola]